MEQYAVYEDFSQNEDDSDISIIALYDAYRDCKVEYDRLTAEYPERHIGMKVCGADQRIGDTFFC